MLKIEISKFNFKASQRRKQTISQIKIHLTKSFRDLGLANYVQRFTIYKPLLHISRNVSETGSPQERFN